MVDSTDLPAQPGAEAPPEQPKLHTQDEVNAILAREKREYEAKMGDLKKKAAEWDKQQEATKTEIQRANEAKAAAEKERDALKLERDREVAEISGPEMAYPGGRLGKTARVYC